MKRIWSSQPIRFVRHVVEIYFSARVSRSAAELAYFLVLTFFPLLICVNGIVASLHLDIALVLDTLERFLPGGVAAILAEYIQYITQNQSTGMFLTGLFTALVSASAAVRALMKSMDDIYGRVHYAGVRKILASVVISVLLLLSIYLSVLVVMSGNWFFGLLEKYLHLTHVVPSWQWLRFVLLFSLVLFFILILYRVTAPLSKPRPPVLPGAISAAVALAGASILFSWFMGMSVRYPLVYGSLTSVIIMLIWLYLCGNILILGNAVNCVLYRSRR